jgi:two-component system, sensor histidine kinase and response regulator
MNTQNPFLILVVDDEEINLDIIDDCLTPAGYKTMLVDHAVKAINVLKSGLKPDLIISDLNMPDMNGFQFYEEVQKLESLDLVPFVFLTSMYDEEYIRYGKELGADDYLKKPFKNPDLLACIRGKLRKAKKVTSVVNTELDKMKENILQMLSHELRTPVTSLVGYAEILGNDEIQLSTEELKEFADMIKEGGDRIKNLTEDFFESLSIDTGDVIKTYNSLKKNFELLPCLDLVISEKEVDLRVKKITIIKEFEENLPLVFGCSAQIINIFRRIIDNAVKFSIDRGKITMKLKKENNFVLCCITNQGRGIPSPEIPKIYNKFYQVDRKKHEQQGSGLGLYIAKKLAAVNKCILQCESIPDEETTFTIQIPVL